MGQIVQLKAGKVLGARLSNSSEVLLSLSFDAANYSPGTIDVTVKSEAGVSKASRRCVRFE